MPHARFSYWVVSVGNALGHDAALARLLAFTSILLLMARMLARVNEHVHVCGLRWIPSIIQAERQKDTGTERD